MAGRFDRKNIWWIYSSQALVEKSLANKSIHQRVINCNYYFSLVNHRQFAKFAKISIRQTLLLCGIYNCTISYDSTLPYVPHHYLRSLSKHYV